MGNTTVHLIRHEQTDANLKRKYIGWTDESISTREKNFIVPISPKVIYGSNLKRCKETAQLYFPEATFIADENLRELNFGDFEMKSYEELKSLSVYRDWIDNPQLTTPPNGESYQQFVQRVLASFQKIVSSDTEYTFVVHGGVIRALLSMYSPMEESFQSISASHRTVYTLQWSYFNLVKEGKRCESLLVEPIMVKENM